MTKTKIPKTVTVVDQGERQRRGGWVFSTFLHFNDVVRAVLWSVAGKNPLVASDELSPRQ